MLKQKSVQYCSRSDLGKVKSSNEDCIDLDTELNIAAVADGIGGLEFGEIAAKLAIESSMGYLREIKLEEKKDKAQRELANAVKVANEAIITIQRNEAKYSKMGSTLACFWLDIDRVHYSWVGDSRIYLLRPTAKQITMLSKDHTLDRSKIDAELAPQLYKRASSILTQTVGSILLLSPDTGSTELNDGDIILACTDGLSDRVQDELLLEYSVDHANDLEAYADKLLDRALDCGGQDNISFVLAQVSLLNRPK